MFTWNSSQYYVLQAVFKSFLSYEGFYFPKENTSIAILPVEPTMRKPFVSRISKVGGYNINTMMVVLSLCIHNNSYCFGSQYDCNGYLVFSYCISPGYAVQYDVHGPVPVDHSVDSSQSQIWWQYQQWQGWFPDLQHVSTVKNKNPEMIEQNGSHPEK